MDPNNLTNPVSWKVHEEQKIEEHQRKIAVMIQNKQLQEEAARETARRLAEEEYFKRLADYENVRQQIKEHEVRNNTIQKAKNEELSKLLEQQIELKKIQEEKTRKELEERKEREIQQLIELEEETKRIQEKELLERKYSGVIGLGQVQSMSKFSYLVQEIDFRNSNTVKLPWRFTGKETLEEFCAKFAQNSSVPIREMEVFLMKVDNQLQLLDKKNCLNDIALLKNVILMTARLKTN